MGWCAAIQQFEPDERSQLLERLEVWGQPQAWSDELICTWGGEHIAKDIGRPSLVYADCLSSQWTSSVLLKAWLENIVWCPYAPDVTSWLQEPDTHEHSQLKAEIRKVKSELHYALEHEYLRAKKTASDPKLLKPPTTWGPFECLHVVNKAYERFQAKYKDKVPLQGLQANQMLRVRPTTEGRLDSVRGTESWSFNITPGRGIPPKLSRQRDQIVESWPENVPPEPDWEFLERAHYTVADDLPL